jgi:hypothetical protein
MWDFNFATKLIKNLRALICTCASLKFWMFL